MKVLEVWFTPHCIDNLVSYTLIVNETNFNINKVKKNAKMLPPPLNFEEREKNKVNCFKNCFEKTNRATGLKSWLFMPITIPHNRLDLWYDSIQTFFKIIFLTINFGHFKPNFGHICPVQVNGGNFQVQDYVFLTSEMKSTLNFSLENMFCFIFWPFLFFHPFGSQTRLESRTLS